ncbi:oxygen-dependent protoporphyrinogen oxidase [Antricoccus suffuscus]|uniref:Coproporphyrinogen III oxidase n=1 Tax=Antricoccus suffuscus TaxID=1629062 RepID=A0A2T1A4Z3_9ACTN|nr:protoporphyrinogen oxidase [Antricoccus suffuscus]PRZ43675.1 oxygen-dependent protoporphyrinogen oxidase [Antricoccus suffuscus]
MSTVTAARVAPLPQACDVLVIGAGISGLSAALRLRKENPRLDVQMIDIADVVGGKLRAAHLADVPIDIGAEALLTRRPEALELIDTLGLGDQMRFPGVLSAKIALADGQYPMPMTSMGVPTDEESLAVSGLLTTAGVAAVRDRQRGAVLSGDVSVAEAIGSRLGGEVVDRLVEPMLGGVYAGRADRLSLAATMPALFARMQQEPDVIEAAKVLLPPKSTDTTAMPVFTTLVDGGVSRLPAAMAEAAGVQVHLRCPARSLRRTADGFNVEVGTGADPHLIKATSVIVATGPSKAAQLLAGVTADGSAALAEVPTASMAVLAFAYRTADLAMPPPTGSGFLVPVSVGTTIKAATYVSNKWPHLVADGTGHEDLFLVRVSVGRIGEEAMLQRPDPDLVALARRDLALLAGISGQPCDVVVQRWGGALPQYDVGHLDRVTRVRQAVDEVKGLAVAGATYQGVGVPACISSGQAAAEVVLSHLTESTEGTSQ